MKAVALLSALALWLLAAAAGVAHPVAQGSIEVRVERADVILRARVSVEEVFVESSFAKSRSSATTLEALWPSHGAYLLSHLFVSADAVPLSGRIIEITPPPRPTTDQFVTYTIGFALPAGAAAPARLSLRQTLLNEFDFAPGNPWEASFVVQFDRTPGVSPQPLLMTSRQPVEVTLDLRSASTGIEQHRLAFDYVHHGIHHILSGWDHLLFMAALVLAAVTLTDLIKVVTAFTLAHTLTLTLSVLDVVRLPSAVVEPMIAASIVFVGLQNVFWPKRTRGWGRLLVAFGFGLFHGLGFAGGLLGAMQGLPGIAVATAITAFSVGVEIGHQAVVLPIFLGLRLARATRPDQPAAERFALHAMRSGSTVISLAGMVYLAAALRG